MWPMVEWLRNWIVSLWRLFIAALKGVPAEVDELLDMRRIIAGMWPIVLTAFFINLFVCGRHWPRGAMWSFACIAVGAATGFLFGIPKVLQHEGKPLPLHRALQDISAIVDQLVTRERPLPAELENVDALSYVWLRCLMPRRAEVTVDSLSKDLRALRVSTPTRWRRYSASPRLSSIGLHCCWASLPASA